MTHLAENFIASAIWIAVAGMLIAAVLPFLKKSFRAANAVLLLSNGAGLLAAIVYFLSFSGRSIIIAESRFFFDLKFELGHLSAIFLALVCGLGVLTTFFSGEYLRRYQKTYDVRTVQFLTSLFILGMVGVLLAGNVFGFMVFWEIMSIASFFLVMADRSPQSGRAAFIYFIMTHLGAGAILGGFLALGGGALDFELSSIPVAATAASPATLSLAFVLLFFGFGSKAGLVPFHIWLPEAHPQAPTHISALMSGLMLKIALYGFLRTVMVFPIVPAWAAISVLALGMVSAFFGALYAAVRRDIKRIFAFSSIENMGIIFAMLGLALYVGTDGMRAEAAALAVPLMAYAIFHAINHAFFKTGLFLASGVIINRVHSRCLELMGGLAKAMPYFSFIFLVIILSAAALPPSGTFFGEWGFIHALVTLIGISGVGTTAKVIFLFILALFALVSGLAAFAMVKTYGLAMLGLPRSEHHSEDETVSSRWFTWPLTAIGLAMLTFGIAAKDILEALMRNMSGLNPGQAENILVTVQISSAWVFGIFALVFLAAVILYELLKKGGREREYHTWDCGQPIDASMEYTATAFSGPIRFFFATWLRRHKEIVSEPMVATNQWIVRKKYYFDLRSIWKEKMYKPVVRTVFWLAEKIRIIHSGRIQYYLLMLLVTIVITLIIAL